MTSLIEYKVHLSAGQKTKLAKAFENKHPHTFRLNNNQLTGVFPLLLTQRQINSIEKAKQNKTGTDIKISSTQMRKQAQSGGFLGALVGLLGRIVPKLLAPLATGALSGLASTGISKMFGNGMISVANNRRNILVPYLTPSQNRQLMGTGVIKLNKKQRQDGGFLGMLAAALGIPLITSLLTGKGLQIDSQQRPYRRIPIVKKKR